MFDREIPARVRALPGTVCLWLENLKTGETVRVNPDAPVIAASVIKLAVLLEAFRRLDDGTLDPNETCAVRPEDKVPSCGALTYLHDGLEVTLRDLATLMIILSDNTATNILIDRLGIENVNRTLDAYDLTGMRLRRKMFDSEAAARGLQNTVTAEGVARFFRLLYEGRLVSKTASEDMLRILLDQRLNGKMPFYLHSAGIRVAHKTGEDDGVTHDAGIILAKEPLIAVFLSGDTDVPACERVIQDVCRTFIPER